MIKQPQYSISPVFNEIEQEKRFLILNDRDQVLKNHLGKDYAPIPQKAAKTIIDDINEILQLDTFLDEDISKEGLSFSEVCEHPKLPEIRKHQEMMSFVVCVHNTLLALQDAPSFSIQLNQVIHWDLLYRMSPGPMEKMEQIHVAFPAIEWLGRDWIDLPANYTSSLEEMEVEEVPLVPQQIIDRLNQEVQSMTLPEQVAVWYLYEYFQKFSITLPILWVKGYINNTILEDTYDVLASGFSLEEAQIIRRKEGDFTQRRLCYLKQYLQTST